MLLCLLISGLVVFFLFPHSVLVDDGGIKVVQVWFDRKNSVVLLAITVKFLCIPVLEGINPMLSCQECHCYLCHPAVLPGHFTDQELQLLLSDSGQSDQSGAVHEHCGGQPADHQHLQHPATK